MDHELKCANCGISIRWQATLVEGRAYCCLGCAEGGPCLCDYDNLPPADEARPMVHQRGSGPWELRPNAVGNADPH
jgi:hypothetical protein